jgi:uncharacterized OB-fold protein
MQDNKQADFAGRTYAAPLKDLDNQPFWDAAKAGVFQIKTCRDCARPHWYPRPLCPYCLSDATEWVAVSGRGTIYSVSLSRKLEPQPYALAFVTLDEGVTVLTNIVDCDLGQLRIGDKVRVVFKPSDGGDAIPVFTPV